MAGYSDLVQQMQMPSLADIAMRVRQRRQSQQRQMPAGIVPEDASGAPVGVRIAGERPIHATPVAGSGPRQAALAQMAAQSPSMRGMDQAMQTAGVQQQPMTPERIKMMVDNGRMDPRMAEMMMRRLQGQ